MKKCRAILCMILVCLLFLSVGCGTSTDKDSLEETIKELEVAFNERDLVAVLDLCLPETRSEINALAAMGNIVSGLTGFGEVFTDELINGVFGVEMGSEYIELDILSVKYDEEGTEAVVLILCTAGEYSSIDVIEMMNISQTWYLNLDL